MKQELTQLESIFSRTKDAIHVFNSMLQPVIENAKDEHERLYFHHILEEEEQRLERLDVLLPMLKQAIGQGEVGERQLVQLMQELNLEKFGLHNFREHLDLAMFEFTDEERQGQLKSMRETTQSDYMAVKELLQQLNNRFVDDNVAPRAVHSIENSSNAKKLTVGSLKRNER